MCLACNVTVGGEGAMYVAEFRMRPVGVGLDSALRPMWRASSYKRAHAGVRPSTFANVRLVAAALSNRFRGVDRGYDKPSGSFRSVSGTKIAPVRGEH